MDNLLLIAEPEPIAEAAALESAPQHDRRPSHFRRLAAGARRVCNWVASACDWIFGAVALTIGLAWLGRDLALAL